jgi:hypothetical protein
MNISKYNYPHPIYGKSGNFNTLIPDFIPTIEFDDSYHIIKIKVEIKSRSINGLISTGKAKLFCEVTCSSTFYRKCFISNNENNYEIEIKIHKSQLRNKVEILTLIIATKSIHEYHPHEVNLFFSEKYYDIEYGDVIAFLGNFYRNVDMHSSETKDFIKIIKDDDANILKFDFNDDYIKIRVPADQFNQLVRIKNDERFSNILISSFVVPGLHGALSHFLNMYDEDNIISNRQWYQFLEYKIQSIYGSDESIITINQISELIEEILKDSSKRLIHSLIEIANDDSLNNDADE